MRKNHSSKQIIGDRSVEVQTRTKLRDSTCLIVDFEPRTVKATLENEFCISAMNKGIDQIEKNNTWILVPRPGDKSVIGTKSIFRNKLNENGEFVRNKELYGLKQAPRA